jgi:hypothetical protein
MIQERSSTMEDIWNKARLWEFRFSISASCSITISCIVFPGLQKIKTAMELIPIPW